MEWCRRRGRALNGFQCLVGWSLSHSKVELTGTKFARSRFVLYGSTLIIVSRSYSNLENKSAAAFAPLELFAPALHTLVCAAEGVFTPFKTGAATPVRWQVLPTACRSRVWIALAGTFVWACHV